MDIRQIDSLAQSHVSRIYAKAARRRDLFLRQGPPQQIIDKLLKGTASPAHLGFQLAVYILFEGQRSSHIMMLACEHHDVRMVQHG